MEVENRGCRGGEPKSKVERGEGGSREKSGGDCSQVELTEWGMKEGKEKSKFLTKQALKKGHGSSRRMTGSPLRTRHLTSVTSKAWWNEGGYGRSHI